MESISVVIPAYRSSESLPPLIAELERVLPTLTGGAPFEAIIVNDGSPDGGKTWAAIRELAASYPWVHGINMMRNYGQHNALLCAIRQARYELIVTIDDDLQHPPSEIAKMLDYLRANDLDVVYGAPEHEQHGLLRDLASQATKVVLQSSMGVDIARKVSAFRVFRAVLRDAFANYSSPYVSIDVLLTWGTTRFGAVTTRHEQRTIGVSGYTLSKLIRHAINMITGFSTLPLQVASIIGLVLAAFGVIILVYVIGRYLVEGQVVQGFPFIASIISIFSGAQLFALGVIGEYLARIHFRTMDRPVYTVREHTQERHD
ncbi:MAG: glycosyltransferase family 2 protein [Chloroflexi bacterium]|uniref:glycosyltransferase family 2 protein n=1 Tax=Candidatus Flexifilum breve TaxID=3140694 RepID=UPI00313695F5|nr:glycosyltransferase family 2 protein [Chloroflexota bacterium]